MIRLGITDVVNTPDSVKLPNGAVITLVEWRLDADCAEALQRPVGSIERKLRIQRPDNPNPKSGTNPSASWYLSKQDYIDLMELISAGKLGFGAAKSLVDGVMSDGDVKAVRGKIALAAASDLSRREYRWIGGQLVYSDGWMYKD